MHSKELFLEWRDNIYKDKNIYYLGRSGSEPDYDAGSIMQLVIKIPFDLRNVLKLLMVFKKNVYRMLFYR